MRSSSTDITVSVASVAGALSVVTPGPHSLNQDGSPKPTKDRNSGTRMPAWWMNSMAPRVSVAPPTTTPVGTGFIESIWDIAAWPKLGRTGPLNTSSWVAATPASASAWW